MPDRATSWLIRSSTLHTPMNRGAVHFVPLIHLCKLVEHLGLHGCCITSRVECRTRTQKYSHNTSCTRCRISEKRCSQYSCSRGTKAHTRCRKCNSTCCPRSAVAEASLCSRLASRCSGSFCRPLASASRRHTCVLASEVPFSLTCSWEKKCLSIPHQFFSIG